MPLSGRLIISRQSCLESVHHFYYLSLFVQNKCKFITQKTLPLDVTFSKLLLFWLSVLLKSCLFAPSPQRPAAEQKELTNKWNEMGTDEPGLQTLPRGFGPEQFAFY